MKAKPFNEKSQELERCRRQIHKSPIQFSGLCGTLFLRYLSKRFTQLNDMLVAGNQQEHLGLVAGSLVSANRWLRRIRTDRFPWYLTPVSTNHASSPEPGPVARFSKVPKTFRVRKAICETGNRLLWKADLLTCFQGNKKQNDCEV